MDLSRALGGILTNPPLATGAWISAHTRPQEERPNKHGLIFPSSVGTMPDLSNFATQWRAVRDDLEHLAGTSGHSFRKSLRRPRSGQIR